MRFLTLIRHAKSSWNDPTLADFDRTLNDRGKRDAPRMAERLAEALESPPHAMVSSPAERARTTAEVIAEGIGYPSQEIRFLDSIYEASLETLLGIVRNLPVEERNVLLVGHNPGFTELVNELTSVRLDNLPTCGIARIEFPVDAWAEIGDGEGKLIDLDYPKKKPSR